MRTALYTQSINVGDLIIDSRYYSFDDNDKKELVVNTIFIILSVDKSNKRLTLFGLKDSGLKNLNNIEVYSYLFKIYSAEYYSNLINQYSNNSSSSFFYEVVFNL